jgi:hypothetical protein
VLSDNRSLLGGVTRLLGATFLVTSPVEVHDGRGLSARSSSVITISHQPLRMGAERFERQRDMRRHLTPVSGDAGQ